MTEEKLEKKDRPILDNYTAVAICEGFEDPIDEEQLIEAWQKLIDTELAWTLQGSFGRIAARMIEEGHCTPPEKKIPSLITKPDLKIIT